MPTSYNRNKGNQMPKNYHNFVSSAKLHCTWTNQNSSPTSTRLQAKTERALTSQTSAIQQPRVQSDIYLRRCKSLW